MLGDRPDWHYRAACRGLTAVMFADTLADAEAARAVCASCPVAEPCRAWAMAHRPTDGVWAGLTPYERMVARRGPRRPAAPRRAG